MDIVYAITLAFDYDRRYREINAQDLYIFVFIIDMVLNFFKIHSTDARDQDPIKIAIHYLKTHFVFDLVAILPYHLMDPDMDEKGSVGATIRFLRLARLSRLVQSARGLIYSFELLCSNYPRWAKKNTVQNISSVIWLMLILTYMCHFLASAWVFIGRRFEDQFGVGWIVRMKRIGTLEEHEQRYPTFYIAGLYYILTTLSTVGYGDIIGTENAEFCFQMIVMIIGIGFFAYFMGKMNTLFQSTGYSDFQDEGLDQWLIRLDKAKKTKVLEHEIFQGVQNFFSQYASKEIHAIKEHPFFQQLKPRLQKTLFDTLFADFYTLFDTAFGGTEMEFRRNIMINMRFKMLQRTQPRTHYINSVYVSRYKPTVYSKDDMPKHVYFIIKGQVFFTNESGTFHYFKLSSGSYFGDINILMNHPSSYSVHFDENAEPVLLLAIKKDKFLKICDKFPDSKRVLIEMAKKRRKQFKIHKIKSLVKLMKVIIRNFDCGFKKIASVDQGYYDRQTQIIEMYQLLVAHYRLVTLRRSLKKKEKFKNQRQIDFKKHFMTAIDKNNTIINAKNPTHAGSFGTIGADSSHNHPIMINSSPDSTLQQQQQIINSSKQVQQAMSNLQLGTISARDSLSQLEEEDSIDEQESSFGRAKIQSSSLNGSILIHQNDQQVIISQQSSSMSQRTEQQARSDIRVNRKMIAAAVRCEMDIRDDYSEDTEVREEVDQEDIQPLNLRNALAHTISKASGASAVVAAVKIPAEQQRLPQFLINGGGMMAQPRRKQQNKQEQQMTPDRKKRGRNSKDQDGEHPRIFTVSPKQKVHVSRLMDSSDSKKGAHIIIEEQIQPSPSKHAKLTVDTTKVRLPYKFPRQSKDATSPSQILIGMQAAPMTPTLGGPSSPLKSLKKQQAMNIEVVYTNIAVNHQTAVIEEEEKEGGSQEDNQDIGTTAGGVKKLIMDDNTYTLRSESLGVPRHSSKQLIMGLENIPKEGGIQEINDPEKSSLLGQLLFGTTNQIGNESSKQNSPKRDLREEKKKLMSFDLSAVEKEFEFIKSKIEKLINKSTATSVGPDGQMLKIDTGGKNEIVHEYFYDSEEEWRIRQERQNFAQATKERQMQKELMATDRLRQEIEMLAQEQARFQRVIQGVRRKDSQQSQF